MILSPLRYLWLIPLTMAPQWFMAGRGAIPNFGPDNSLAILPMPYLVIYYGIFFFWGHFITMPTMRTLKLENSG